VRWFLSIDANDLPDDVKGKKPPTATLTSVATSLSSLKALPTCTPPATKEILAGRGYGLEDARHCIETVNVIRNAHCKLAARTAGEVHPFVAQLHPALRPASP
jgi:UDP-N-acetyl-2-amino-2-deoxyglucuronate dehydrogenase